ncbi:hypothetical protein B5F40_05605 [Gordonibacter sp. An230]|uniref:hypothetical protein n=1 Tax=Gordonibacter sp. An230 TaxID=1965592 RepID=UPI000B36FE87|nr:hypothetical protein [Gordonibacter sp. An230]OUO90771.1 hypothetical protein B5F40_05605 [Gordonibacter sp. An230]
MAQKRVDGKDGHFALQFYGTQVFAALPILLYMTIAAIITIGVHYYGMEALIFASIIGLLTGFFLCRNKLEYWASCVRGLTQFGNANLIFIFIIIAIFGKILVAGGIGSGLLWAGLNIGLQGGSFVVLVFIGCAIFSMGSGAPFPALMALVPIFYPTGIMLGADATVLVGAMISGVLFGDALSPSSQVIHVTINSQHDPGTGKPADLVEVMKARSPYLVAIAIVSAALFLFLGGAGDATASTQELSGMADARGLLMFAPIALLLAICIKTRNLLMGVGWAIPVGIVLGMASGLIEPSALVSIDFAQQQVHGVFMDGITSSVDLVLSSILLFGMIQIATEGGVLKMICDFLTNLKMAKKPRGAEGIVVLGTGAISCLLSGAELPTVIMFKDVVDNVGQRSGISANRRSILLMAMATNIPAIVPVNSIFIMTPITLVAGLAASNPALPLVAPVPIFLACFYPMLLAVVCFMWVMFGLGRKRTACEATGIGKEDMAMSDS